MNTRKALMTAGLVAVLFILSTALYLQFARSEQPCPLCLLQRAGFSGVGLALLMNIKYGETPSQWGLLILSAIVGIAVSIRQICLHITSPVGFAPPLLGLHLYTWCFIAFSCVLVGAGFMLIGLPRSNFQLKTYY